MTAYLRNIQVSNVTEAATAIYNLLVDQGWNIETGSPSSSMVLSGKEVNSVKPYLRFTNPSGNILRLNGDATGNGSSLSLNRDWTVETGSRLWMAADDEACCIYIKPTTGSGNAYHAGALDRADPNDGWAWAVGVLTNSSVEENVYQIAQQLNSTNKWQSASARTGVFGNIFTGEQDSSTLNTPVLGAPILAPYFRFNGADYRGIVKFAVSGLAGATPGTEYEQRDPVTNAVTKIYVCSGTGAFEVFSAYEVFSE